MRIADYLKDKGIFLTLNLMIFIVISIFMYIADISFVMILFIFCIWFLPLFTYIFIEYIKYKKYFNDMESILESLDKKYLLTKIKELGELDIKIKSGVINPKLGMELFFCEL